MRTPPGPPSPMLIWQPPTTRLTMHGAAPALKYALYPCVGTTPPLQLPWVVQMPSEGWVGLPAGFHVVAVSCAFAKTPAQSKNHTASPPQSLRRFLISINPQKSRLSLISPARHKKCSAIFNSLQ